MTTPNPVLANQTLQAVKILNQHKKQVWPKILKYLKDPNYPPAFQIPSKYNQVALFHWKIATEYPKRQGKYLRPTLLILTCQAMGGEKRKALQTAAAMQISEEWLLIHDDLEDNSLKRRGKATLHQMYNLEQAVNAGDTLHTIMWKIIVDNQTVLGPQKTFLIAQEFHRILMRTALGQTVELKWTKENKEQFSDSDWFFIADGKTSYYTIAGPMRLGAIIANATPKQLDKIAHFGKHLGRCFQIVDDILDITSDFSGLKKQTGNDIYEGKRTIILGHLLRNAQPNDKEKLISILQKNRQEKTAQEVNWVINKMHQYHSLDHAKKIAQQLASKSLEIFEKDLLFLSHQPARKQLKTLIEFVLERDH